MVDHDPEVTFEQNQILPTNRCGDIRLQNQKFVQKMKKNRQIPSFAKESRAGVNSWEPNF